MLEHHLVIAGVDDDRLSGFELLPQELLRQGILDQALGARPLRRAIQRLVEDPLSEKLLNKEFRASQTIIVDGRDGEIVFEGAPVPPDVPPVELAGSES